MRVFVAGASGVIGVPLVRQLVAAGHEVTGTTSKQENVSRVEAAGATAVVCDALDPQAVVATVRDAAPEVVISQLTRLPSEYNPRKIDYGPTNRARAEGGHNLIEAARVAGVRRLVTQSVAFLYAPEGGWVKPEDEPVWLDAPPPFDESIKVLDANERKVSESTAFEGLALRYGFFYGPGTYYASDGSIAAQVRKRRFPLVGSGDAMTSYVHVADAAAATVAALDRGAPGIYNVVDDDPAPLREWLPAFAEAIGAKRPLRVPAWVARLAAGRFASAMSGELRGASNAKAKAALGWQPALPSWREGFRTALDADPASRAATPG